MKILKASLLVLTLTLLAFAPARAATNVVTSTLDGGAGSLRNAVTSANPGDTIIFTNTLSGQTITLTSGQITLNKSLTIDASALTNGIAINGNHASRIFEITNATVLIDSLTITNGYAPNGFNPVNRGGGILSRGATVTLTNCTLVNNQAVQDPGGDPATAGAIENFFGVLNLNNCTFKGNTSPYGGAVLSDSGTTRINQCTFSGNQANHGGGYFNANSAGSVNQCTFSGNTGTNDGGGIYIDGTMCLSNSIVAGNTGATGSDIFKNSGTLITGGVNLTNGNPLLAPLGNYGGPTPTMPPLPGSPAMDTGGATSLTTDQRGFPRPVDTADIGAVEFQKQVAVTAAASAVLTTLATLNGTVKPGDANVSYYFQYGLATNYGSFTPANPLAATNVTLAVSNLLTGLSLVTTYHFQLVVSNGVGMSFGADQTFTTLGNPPAVITLAASGVTNTTGTLNGTVNPNGLTTAYYFQYGADTNYGSATPANSLAAGGAPVAVSNFLSGFTADITNHYRLVATNSSGTTFGNDLTFSAPIITLLGAANLTNECHAAFTDPGASNSAGFAVSVSGSVNTNSPATYPLTYTGTNTLGGFGTASRIVVVQDTAPPVVTLLGGNPLTLLTNTPFVDPGATALDTCAGNLTVTTNSTVNVALAGTYSVSYSANDGNGHSATNTRTVVVRGPTTLVVTTNSDDGNAGSLRAVVANSIFGDTITFTNPLSGSTILLTNGEIVLDKSLTIDGSALPVGITIDGNGSSRVFNVRYWNVRLDSLTITHGFGGNGDGGGIYNIGTLTVDRCTIVGNAVGDGLWAAGNSNARRGGGIFNDYDLTLNQCTITGNAARSITANASYNAGGGLFNRAIAVVNHCTIVGNFVYYTTVNNGDNTYHTEPNYGSGISSTISLEIYNSIVALNTGNGPELYATSSFTGQNNLTNATPMLAALGHYGGPTLTAPPLPNSPAIDGCTNGSTFNSDQRGFPRPVGAFADIGAVETGTSAVAFTSANRSAGGAFQFTFGNLNGTVWATTNLATGTNTWVTLPGTAVETPPGSGAFQFTDLQATNHPQRFYRVSVPVFQAPGTNGYTESPIE